MGDNGNGPDRVIVCILLHKRHKRHRHLCHKRHRYHQYSHSLQYLMETLVALEDDKDPDRENEHMYMYLNTPMMNQQLRNNKVA